MQISRFNILTKNHVCPWWMAYSFDNPIRKLFHKPHRLLATFVREGMTVMDVGCGMGFFSIGMAKMVGDRGKVLSLDLQPKMLAVTEKRAERAGVADRISTHLCRFDDLGVDRRVDFILTFWMVHEVRNKTQFFRQLHSNLVVPHGNLLIAEPKMHVTAEKFQQTLQIARSVGLKLDGQPPIRFSRSALFKKRTLGV